MPDMILNIAQMGVKRSLLESQKMLQVLPGGTYSNYSAILKDVTNIGHASPTPHLNKLDHDKRIAEPPGIENTPDHDELNLNKALALKEDGRAEEAFPIFQTLAAENNRRAQFELGEMYFHGNFVERNYVKAMEHYTSAANLYDDDVYSPDDSYEDAFNKIGYLYERGLGVDQNYLQAARYFRIAALGGNKHACCNLAYLYEHGFGVSASNQAAVYWYSQAGIHF